ncbi:MAG: CHAT domain-containing protein [Clostridia bacterium]|nr:CHAT domain-containing protein [Clostridia bacterium]
MRFIKMTVLLCCMLLLSLCWSGAAEDVETAESGQRRALLIGCDHFLSQPDTWPAAENNVRALSDVLFSDARSYALVRTASNTVATVEVFEEAVLAAFGNSAEIDTSVLYLSTHGVFEDGISNANAGLLLSDGQTESLLDGAALERILDQVPGKKVVILDACNSGAIIGKGLSGGADTCFLSGPEYKVLCSAGGSEASWYYQSATAAAEGASYFCAVLASGLGASGGHAADQNDDGQITLAETYAYLLEQYAASTPQVYPQHDEDEVLFVYDPDVPVQIRKAITGLTFEDTLVASGDTEISFSFTVQRQTELYYQIIYHRDGDWQFSQAQQIPDNEQDDGSILPGRKMRVLSLNTGEDDYGYAIIQLITLENGTPVFQGARLLCVQPASGEVNLRAVTGKSFVPALGQEMAILAQHDVPCGLTVNILNEENRLVRRLAYDAPSRPQQLSPVASSFYWDGKTNSGEYAPAGVYTVQVKTYIGETMYFCRSEPFLLEEPSY